jgi:cytochrome P450
MNTRKSSTRLSSAYPTPGELARYEREARRLRAEFIANGVARLVIALDRLVRRIACRIAARLLGSDCMHAPAR